MQPKLHVKVCAKKEGMDCVCKGLMPSLDWSILTRVVSTCWMDGASFLVEEVSNFGMVAELTPLIQVNALVITVWVALGKEMGKPLQGRSF